jgi:hypothetical protein
MIPRMPMRQALLDDNLLGYAMSGSSWYGWRVLLIAAAGEELTDAERREFTRLTGRDREPGQMVRELVAIFGRRAGKSLAMAVFICWVAGLCDHRSVLAPGEVGVALLISRDQRISKIILNYIFGILQKGALLRSLIVNRTAETIELKNGVSIEVRPANYKTLRGPTYVCIVCDEIAHWFTSVDFSNPDVEILAAVRPGLMTTHGPLLMVSSAYAKNGELYDAYKKYYGPAGPADILVAYGTSRDLNPSLSQHEIDRELKKDPVRNRAEYLSEFRADIEGFIPRDIVEACVGDYHELPPQPGFAYRCFVDQASGIGEDSYAMAIAHKYGVTVIVDAIREVRPPFSPAAVVNDVLVPLCKTYGVSSVTSDDYAAGFSRALIFNAGLAFAPAKKHKSELYLELLPLLNSHRISLPRNDRLVNQIAGLERSTQRSGRDYIDHAPNSHDDVANAVAGAADLAYNFSLFDFSYGFVDGNPLNAKSPAELEAERRRQKSDYDNYYELCRKFGQPPPCPPWGVPRSKSPEEEQRESDENARWRISVYLGMLR